MDDYKVMTVPITSIYSLNLKGNKTASFSHISINAI